MRLDELATKIGAELVGDGSIEITSVATLEEAKSGQLSFLANPKYQKQLETTQASVVIVAKRVSHDRLALLKAGDPYFAFAQAVVALHGFRQHPHAGVHAKANVDSTASIGEGTVIYPGAFVGPRCKIGRDCIIYPNAVLYDGTILGDRVIVHAGTVLGVDGYGFATHDGVHHKIPQIGNVIIEDDVEIGANCVIARAAVDRTVIGRGSKIDGSVVVGHGTTVGPHALLVAQVGIAGSVTIGHHVSLGGQVGVAGHVTIGDEVSVAAKGGIIGDVESKSIMLGMPAMPFQRGRRVYGIFSQLPELVARVKALEEQVGDINESGDTPMA